MLSIGAVFGGPEERLADRMIMRLMRAVSGEVGQSAAGDIGGINAVFHVPGSLIPDVGFEGLRDGTFSRERGLLVIQISVPEEIASSDDAECIRQFLFQSLQQANKVAAKYFKKKGVDYSQPKYFGLLEKVQEAYVRHE